MTIRDLLRLAPVAAVLLSLPANAQQSTISKVVFQNAGPYKQPDLEAAAGVHVGQKMALADMQAAAQRLVDTGCFDNVALDSHGTPGALTLVFALKPSGTGVIHQIGFGNLVWFTEDELMAIVRKVDPLAGSGLPEGGAVLDSISEALQVALAAKGVPDAQVGHTLELPSSANPASVIEYRVNKPFVVLGSISLGGVAPEFAAPVRETVTRLQGKPYLTGPSEGTERAVLGPYRNAGYLEARLVDVQTSYAVQKPGVVAVDVKAKVSAGSAYRVATLHWEGSPLVPATAFPGMQKLHEGDAASEAKLLETIAPIDTAYHQRGYMDEYVDSGAHLDSAAHTVSYDLKVVPGDIYYVHNVDVQGLSPEARAQFDQAWALKTGTPYDPAYVKTFVTNNTVLPALRKYAGRFSAAADPATHQVDVTVEFVPIK